MSIGAHALAQAPIAADPPATPKNRPPVSRTLTAIADAVQQPEAR